jgi:hypothetical protein
MLPKYQARLAAVVAGRLCQAVTLTLTTGAALTVRARWHTPKFAKDNPQDLAHRILRVYSSHDTLPVLLGATLDTFTVQRVNRLNEHTLDLILTKGQRTDSSTNTFGF